MRIERLEGRGLVGAFVEDAPFEPIVDGDQLGLLIIETADQRDRFTPDAAKKCG